MGKIALVAGATGLVGGSLLDKLLKDDTYDKVKVVSRKQLSKHDKLEVILVNNFDKLADFEQKITADDVFCCLGTTMAKAKSKEAFRKVDYDYPVLLADLSLKNGARQFIIISAMGANKNSSIYYNKVKGELEQELLNRPFRELHILKPSLLLGPRDEKRTGEDAAKKIYKVLNFAFVGPLKKYKGIQADQVAKAMLHYAKNPTPGKHIHENEELLEIK